MGIPYGIDFFGHVDRVRGLYYVATRCHHIGYLPIVPDGSYVVIEGSEVEVDNEWWQTGQRSTVRCKRVPFQLRSYVHAWLRWVTVVGGVILGAGGVARLLQEALGAYHWYALIVAGVLLPFVVVLGWFRRTADLSGTLAIPLVLSILAALPLPIERPVAWTIAGVFLLAIAALSQSLTRATHKRALALAAELGIPEKLVRDHLRKLGIHSRSSATQSAFRPPTPPARSAPARSAPAPVPPSPVAPPPSTGTATGPRTERDGPTFLT